CPELGRAHEAIVDGDAHCHSIAAASVIAKTVRDRLMELLASRHPTYAWASNKGYATPDHLAALAAFGFTSHHRKSFAPAVQLEQTPRRRAGATQRVEIEGVWLTLAHEAPRRVSDRVDPRVFRGAHEAAGQLLLALIEPVVDGGHDVVRVGQHVVGQVELSVLEDVELDAPEDGEAATLGVPGVDRLPLLPQPLRVEPQRHGPALRLIGDGDVFV